MKFQHFHILWAAQEQRNKNCKKWLCSAIVKSETEGEKPIKIGQTLEYFD